jgi:hypothetical protein
MGMVAAMIISNTKRMRPTSMGTGPKRFVRAPINQILLQCDRIEC